jgi:cytochrome P450
MGETKEATGPKGHFLFGMAMEFKRDPLGFLSRVERDYPGIARFRFAHLPMVNIGKPEYVKHVMQVNNKNYCKGIEYDHLKHILGQGLLTSEGDFWLRQRRLVQPAFHKKRIESFSETITNSTASLCKEWEERDQSEGFDVHLEMMRLTLDIVGRTLFSSHVIEDASKIERALSAIVEDNFKRIQTTINPPIWLPVPQNLRLKRNIKVLDKVVLGIIEHRREIGEDQGNDLLTMLMEVEDEDTGEKMSNLQLRDEVMTIFLAGHETTANALSWALYLLSTNPDAEAKFHAELQEVLGNRVPTFEDARNLPYTMAVINESMRLYPPAWVLGRTALADDEIDGFRIRKGDNIMIVPYLVHRNSEYWEDAEAFKPERFATDEKIDKFQFFPFGGGPRFCIGNNFAILEMQLVLAMIGQRFKLRLEKEQVIEPEPLITLRPRHGIQMKIV